MYLNTTVLDNSEHSGIFESSKIFEVLNNARCHRSFKILLVYCFQEDGM